MSLNPLEENELFSPHTPENQSPSSLKRMLDQFEPHFENHVIKGKIIKLEEGCHFCKHHKDQLQRRAEQIVKESGIPK